MNSKKKERWDDLQIKGYQICQKEDAFCFGMDAVLLSHFTQVKPGERVLDLGTGNGVIPILLEAKTKGKHFTGLEIQEGSVELARKSVAYNHLEDRVSIVYGDIKEAGQLFAAASFDVVTSNPPYMIGQHGLTNPNSEKAIARHEICCTLEDVVAAAAKVLKPKGRFYMVHRPFRLAEILRELSAHGLEPKRMQLVYPFVDKEPTMVLVEARRDAKPRMTVEKPLIIYEKQGIYTKDILEIYHIEE